MTVDPRIERYTRTLEQVLFDARTEPSLGGGNLDALDRLGDLIEQYIAQTEQRTREAQLLQAITTRVSTGLTLEEMLDYVYESFREVIPYQRMGLALIEADGSIARSRWAKSDQRSLLLDSEYTAPLEGSSLQTILETGRPRILNDLLGYLEQKPGSVSTRLIVEEGFRSSLTCPLIASGLPVGFLFFTSREKATYANRHIEIFMQIADRISILLEKGRLASELASQKRELEQINLNLQNIDAARRAILAIAAHDLRAPLGYIKTSTDVLLSTDFPDLDAKAPEIIGGIRRQTQHMLDLLDKLLDYSVIEAGQMRLAPVAVAVDEWIVGTVEQQFSYAQAKEIKIEILPVPAGQFEIDPIRMAQVLTNLLSNALKFSATGSRVSVETSKDENAWRIAVHDQGPGIRPGEEDHLFRPFQRGYAQPTGGEKSTGLGLAIARSIVVAHGGDIGVKNNPPMGATFWFTVPA